MMSHSSRYSMLIQWCEEDECYTVTFPELQAAGRALGPTADGLTYAEAAENGYEALGKIIDAIPVDEALPAPFTYPTTRRQAEWLLQLPTGDDLHT